MLTWCSLSDVDIWSGTHSQAWYRQTFSEINEMMLRIERRNGVQVWNSQSDVPNLFSIVLQHYMSLHPGFLHASAVRPSGKGCFEASGNPPPPATFPLLIPKALAAVSVGAPCICLQSSFFFLKSRTFNTSSYVDQIREQSRVISRSQIVQESTSSSL